MVDRVLVPMDGSEMSVRALEYALDVHDGADITVLFVAGEPSPMMGRALQLALETDPQEAAEELADEVFEQARDRAAEHGVEIDTEVALGSPARQIIDRARDVDAVVIGSHGGGPPVDTAHGERRPDGFEPSARSRHHRSVTDAVVEARVHGVS